MRSGGRFGAWSTRDSLSYGKLLPFLSFLFAQQVKAQHDDYPVWRPVPILMTDALD